MFKDILTQPHKTRDKPRPSTAAAPAGYLGYTGRSGIPNGMDSPSSYGIVCAELTAYMDQSKQGRAQKKISHTGIDIAKNVFEVHGIDKQEVAVFSGTRKRGRLLNYFAGLEPREGAMEACGSAHHWARDMHKLGYEEKLIKRIGIAQLPNEALQLTANRLRGLSAAERGP